MSDRSGGFAAFISYTKPDLKAAQAIATALEERGFTCWIAPRDVRPGRSYGDEIIRGIEKSRAFVLVLSAASNGSAFVAREVERAVSKNKPVFTIRIGDVAPAPALELFIAGTQWIDAFLGDRLAARMDQLAAQLADDEGEEVDKRGEGQVATPAASPSRRFLKPAALVLGVLLLAAGGALLGQIFSVQPASMLRPIQITRPATRARARQRLPHASGRSRAVSSRDTSFLFSITIAAISA